MCGCILALPNELKKVNYILMSFVETYLKCMRGFFFVSLLKDTVNVGVRWYFSNKLTFVIKKIPND